MGAHRGHEYPEAYSGDELVTTLAMQRRAYTALYGAQDGEKAFRPLEVPVSYRSGWPEDIVPGNVARLYARMARDLRDGTRTAPSFEDAVAVHRVIAAIERAAESGSRTAPA
jgi:predicted dehydrogenase